MTHRFESYWGMARLREELDCAESILALYASGEIPMGPRAEARIASWSEFADQLRDRMTVLGLTAELDALEAK